MPAVLKPDARGQAGRDSDACGPGFGWTLPVARWAAHGAEETAPAGRAAPTVVDTARLDPMLRRRLSVLGKLGMHVAMACAAGAGPLRMIYASRHGELHRTTTLLESLAAEEAVSPTAFSLSVLNATAGVYSIACADPSPQTAIAAGEESLGFGLLEAAMSLAADPAAPVLFVYADEPIPALYGAAAAGEPEAHALAMLLQAGAPETIHCHARPAAGPSDGHATQYHALMRCLRGESLVSWSGECRAWVWTRDGE